MNKNSLFDDVARTLASPIPRRRACAQILRGLAVAAVASLSSPGVALAGGGWKCKHDKDCKKHGGGCCCHKVCCSSGVCCNNVCCGPKQSCDPKKGKCVTSVTKHK
jgi:hypothetical protein